MSRGNWWPSLLSKMNTSFAEWKAAQTARAESRSKGKASRRGDMALPTTARRVQGVDSQVMSYSSMVRASRETGYRPPSEVGSIKSFRSTQTTEEQISAIESRIDRVEANQDETNKKLDAVLALLTQAAAKQPSSK